MTSREKFEAWYLQNWGRMEDNHETLFERCPDGDEYYRLGVRMAHAAWQAAESVMAAQLSNAESKCRELAAENTHARERHLFIRALAVSIIEHSGGRMDWRGAMEDATELLQTVDSVYAKTPATDAFLAEVRAQGVEMFGNATLKIGEEEDDEFVVYAGKQALLYANQLRKGAAL
ncbi:hypothetical protein [Citrobacter freundii]|uniref:hypothetical protein n=1 Tax=Citrobacter freundii TaxID=546 RepID=UPI00383B43A6